MNTRLSSRKLSLLAGIAVAAFAFAAPDRAPPGLTQISFVASAEAQARLSVSVFYDELAPHGRWIRHPAHGYVWTPRAVRAGWRPYTEGRWVHTERHGWYWQSSEPFGWATYHYGRWGYQRAYGWYWVPGTQWAPAWVVWRVGGESIGWAPIAPDRRGYASSIPTRYRAPVVESWVFVETRYVSAPRLVEYVVPIREIPVYLRQSPDIVTINVQNNVIINQPIEITQIQQVLAEPMASVEEITFVTDPAQATSTEVDVQQITAFQADLSAPAADAAPPEAAETPEEVETVTRLDETVEEAPPEAEAPSAANLDDAGVEADLEEAEETSVEAPAAAETAAEEPTDPATPVAEEPEADTSATEEPTPGTAAEPEAEVEVEAEAAADAEAEAEVETPEPEAPAVETPAVEAPAPRDAPAEAEPEPEPEAEPRVAPEAAPAPEAPAAEPPAEAPAEAPPVEAPPVEAPPVEAPSVEAPPVEAPAAEPAPEAAPEPAPAPEPEPRDAPAEEAPVEQAPADPEETPEERERRLRSQ
ncbi:MAG TPA: DUF6600 domain-containing protein [Saliniramus sp.]|nr:DUF6600 domain-containing protein [Saliniramus sp.]